MSRSWKKVITLRLLPNEATAIKQYCSDTNISMNAGIALGMMDVCMRHEASTKLTKKLEPGQFYMIRKKIEPTTCLDDLLNKFLVCLEHRRSDEQFENFVMPHDKKQTWSFEKADYEFWPVWA